METLNSINTKTTKHPILGRGTTKDPFRLDHRLLQAGETWVYNGIGGFEPGSGGGASSADNGLSVDGSDIVLGGNLTGDTEIDLGSSNLSLVGEDRTVRFEDGTIFVDSILSDTGQTFLRFNPVATHEHVDSPFTISVGDALNNGPTFIYPNRVWWWGVNNVGSGTAYNPNGIMWGDVIESSWVSGDVPFYERHNVFKMPGKDALRLQSWTLQHPNDYYGTSTFNFDYYQIINQFTLRSVKNEVGSTYTHVDYFGLGFNPTTGTGQLSMVTAPGMGLQISGAIGQPSVYITATGTGTNDINFGQNDVVTFGGGGQDYYSASARTLQSNVISGIASMAAPRIDFAHGLAATTGIFVNGQPFLSTGAGDVDVFLGWAGRPSASYSGNYNIGIGHRSSSGLSSGSYNIAIGPESGEYISTGSNNILLGYKAGYTSFQSNPTVSGAILIGHQAGNFSFNPANKLVIENSNGSTPLISGDFSTNQVGINVANAAPNASATFEVASTTGGILFPRMDETARDAIGSPANGLVLYNTTSDKLQVRAAGAWVDLH